MAPRTGFEPVTYRLTVSQSQKHRSVDIKQPEKPVLIIQKSASAKKLSEHNRIEPVAQYLHTIL